MNKTNTENVLIANLIETELNVSFANYEYSLDKWGYADNYCQMNEETLILLEYENGQKHPNTNVLKLWPYMEAHTDLRVILFHYFSPENKAPKNRLALCEFLKTKLEQAFPDRFVYIRLSGNFETMCNQLKEYKKGLIQELFIVK